MVEESRPKTRGLIVILDDEAIILMGLACCWKAGVSGAVGLSLDEAVQQVADEIRTPDLIIADYRLADGNTGPEAINAIREISSPRIPGIVLTGDTGPGILERVGKRGFGILHKPVAADDLHRIVWTASNRSGPAASDTDFDRRVDDVDQFVLVVLVGQEDAAGRQHAAGADMDADLP